MAGYWSPACRGIVFRSVSIVDCGRSVLRRIYRIFVPVIIPLFLWAGEITQHSKDQEEEFARYREAQSEQMRRYKKEQQRRRALSGREFSAWKSRQELEYRAFKEQILREWGEFIAPTEKRWVEYSRDRMSFSVVDFERGMVVVKVIKRSGEPQEETGRKLTRAVKRVLSSRGSSLELPLEADKAEQQLLQDPVLRGQVVLPDGRRATAGDAVEIVNGENGAVRRSVEPMESGDGHRVGLEFPLAPDHVRRRMEPFLPQVRKYCDQYALEPELVLAIIHTESSFNPLARSGAGAVGLMQLVPEKGGADAYAVVFGKTGIPSGVELLDPELNIQLGCAYLNRLQSGYFGEVVNREKNRYCCIAGYNTGPGNVAYAFSGSRAVGEAVVVINRMGEEAVYDHLLRRLPYVETREYLRMVVGRMRLYRR